MDDTYYAADDAKTTYTDWGITARWDDMGYILPKRRAQETEEEETCTAMTP